MNESLLKLIDLLKTLNGGKMESFLEANLIAFADESVYDIKTIDDLVEAIETESSYYTDN